MPAYIIANVTIADPVRYQEYARLVESTVAAYDGRYRARGGSAHALEGNWIPRRVVILEFPDFERAQSWWASQDYAPVKRIRQEAAKTEMILVDGL